MELLQTERDYVDNLRAVVEVAIFCFCVLPYGRSPWLIISLLCYVSMLFHQFASNRYVINRRGLNQ